MWNKERAGSQWAWKLDKTFHLKGPSLTRKACIERLVQNDLRWTVQTKCFPLLPTRLSMSGAFTYKRETLTAPYNPPKREFNGSLKGCLQAHKCHSKTTLFFYNSNTNNVLLFFCQIVPFFLICANTKSSVLFSEFFQGFCRKVGEHSTDWLFVCLSLSLRIFG